MRTALTAARLRPRVGIDDAIGGALTLVALVLLTMIGVHDSRRPVYGPIDEVTHTAYVLAVAKDGIPPFLGRDRAFVAVGPLAKRDVRIPPPDKTGSAPIPIGSYNEVRQSEAIQPPVYYYAAAPVTWFVSGRDKVIALRLFDVFLFLSTLLIIFFAVRDIGESPLGGGVAALLFGSALGLIDIFSYVTNGAMMLFLGALVLWLAARALRDRRLTWSLALAAAALAATHTIVIPLAAIAVVAPAVAQFQAQGRAAWRTVWYRLLVAASPLCLWMLANLYRYHWVTPRSPGESGTGFSNVTTTPLDLPNFTNIFYQSIISSAQDAFHPWVASPYVYDWRPLSLFIVLTTIGVACALFRASERQRRAVGYWLLAGLIAHVTVFGMLYLAVILTGSGDFVYRYFSAAQVAAACLAGTAFGYLFRNPTLQRAATIIVGIALAYWTYNSSPL